MTDKRAGIGLSPFGADPDNVAAALTAAEVRGYRRGLAEATQQLLTDEEHAAIAAAGELWNQLCHIVGRGPSRAGDLAELAALIHGIQRAVMKNAAARAYPDRYRLLGELQRSLHPAAAFVPISELTAEIPRPGDAPTAQSTNPEERE